MAENDDLQFSKALALIIAHAWEHPTFLKALIEPGADPHRVLEAFPQFHIKLPPVPNAKNARIQFVENTEDLRYVVIPRKPHLDDADFSLLVKLRQLETGCTDSLGRPKIAQLIDDVKKFLDL